MTLLQAKNKKKLIIETWMFIIGDIFIHQQQQLGFPHSSGDPNDHFYAHKMKPEHYKLLRAEQTECNVSQR